MLPSLECTLLGPKTQVSFPPPWQNDPILPGSSKKVLPIGPNKHTLSIPFLVPIGQCLALPYEKQSLLLLVPSVDCAFLGHYIVYKMRLVTRCFVRHILTIRFLYFPVIRLYASRARFRARTFEQKGWARKRAPYIWIHNNYTQASCPPRSQIDAYFCPPIEFL